MSMKKKKTKPKKLIFLAQDLGVPLDNLTREDIYSDTELKPKNLVNTSVENTHRAPASSK
ncbi:MAG: hypothetical protein COY81_01845 [Candidatus Pacebacteria bacterium CG_4_10_14_0_8_um_filter_43_12]|nr:MAG: hypothetical protein COU66_01135 [Candidatus Pacebacteria bacterium CG10_big_fil_rev_8_21_14_0_10_44_11]PIY79595.1 MAG: hypothetical protein COY81_01845 [Candidatus Pacebacteria bacterium CG_4_10_14_0_8_um_filter_43_12]